MAVTSIWPVKSHIKTVIDYARNPEKTVASSYEQLAQLHKIDDVVQYSANDMKTERREFVSGVNCNENHAAEDFMTTKRYWEKTDGRLCYHGYQSFAKGETTAATAHAIGVELAKRLWGDRFEVLVATHCNTGCYHNHFVLNSVSFLDGKKFYNSPMDYQAMRNESDRLCMEHGLSVLQDPKGRKKNYAEWDAERNGKPVIRGTIRSDIDAAIFSAADGREFVQTMEAKGYEFKFVSPNGTRLKWPSVKPPDSPRFFRLERLGEGYGMADIINRIERNPVRRNPFPEDDREKVFAVRTAYRVELQKRKATGLYALYLRYCYELRIIQRFPASAKRVSFFMREDLTKLSKLDEQTRFLGRTGIKTIEELRACKAEALAQIEDLTTQRAALRNALKRALRQNDFSAAEQVKEQISDTTAQIKKLRKEVNLCDCIESRSGQVVRELSDIDLAQDNKGKEKTDNELFR